MTTMTTGFGKTKKNKPRDLSLSRDPFSHIDCHFSKIVHLVSSRDHVTSNNDEKIYINLDERALL